jgi:MoaA/NifB/PqqE/SkfB family radical SAM enzyme/glycosyltransferase involved in cell wall biosynthesis
VRVCILTRGDLFPTDHGAAVKIVRTATHLARATGAPVSVVTDDRDRYLRFDGDRVEEVAYPPRFRAAEEWPGIPRLGRLAERLCGRLGYPQEEHFLYRPYFDPAWTMRAIEVGRLEGIDVFQAEFPGYGVPAALAARGLGALRRARGGRAPVSSIVQHNVEWDRLAEFGHDVRWIRQAERAALRMVDEVIAVSTDDRDRMVEAGVDAAAITVIPHGVDAAPFRAATGRGIRERYGIAPDAPLLFFHGTLHYWPNTEAVRFLVEQLLPRLLRTHPDARVLVCGRNPPMYYAHPAVVFTGSVEDLAAHVAAADVCLCPVFAGGGTRMKLLEYMAAGQAIVSATKGAEGIQYVDGRDLLIADAPDDFAAAVGGLIDDPARRRALGEAAARFAFHYDWSAVGEAYVRLYAGEGRGEDWNARLLESEPVVPPAAPRPVPVRRLALPDVGAHLPADRTPSKPLTMLLLVNRGCNLRCSFCDLWEDHVHMPLEQVLPLLDDAAAIGTKTLVLTGGEPFLHPDLFTIVEAGRARGMGVNITTNGTLLDRRWQEVLSSGVSSLSFSIDGLAGTHDALRGQEGAFKRTMAALRKAVQHGGLSPSVYFTVTSENVHELVEVFEQVHALGAGFDFWPVNDAEDLYLRTPEQQAAFMAAVDHIGAKLPEVAARRTYYRSGLAYHAGEAGPVRCLGLVDQFGVKYTGEFLPCCVWDGTGLVLGNVNETPLRELWTAEPVQAFREGMFHQGCTAGCFNHSLYEFEVSTGLPAPVGAPSAAR